MQKTTIDDILNSIIITQKPVIDILSDKDIDYLVYSFLDGTISYGRRKQIYYELFNRNQDIAKESITNLCRTYIQTNSKDLENFIIFMLDHTSFDIFTKIECVLTLKESNHPYVRSHLIAILRDYSLMSSTERPSIAIYIEMMRYLFEPYNSNENKIDNNLITEYIKWLLEKSKCQTLFLYKTILSIQRDSDRLCEKIYLDELYMVFFFSNIDDQYKILASQYILDNIENLKSKVELDILSIASDITKSYNIRADSADLLIKLGSNSVKTKANKIIISLSKDVNKLNILSNNRQNVHLVDKNVEKFLRYLGGIKSDHNIDIIIKDINNFILNSKYKNSKESINASLLRIKIDQMLYPGSQTLESIFIKVYNLIINHNYKNTLLERLIEELIDMTDTCSTGHANRLVNVFSGIGYDSSKQEFSLFDGSFKIQIKSNIIGRLLAKINTLNDQQYKDDIILQMNNLEMEDRQMYSKFLRENIGDIRDNMKKEFLNIISDDDFELYFRTGVLSLETGNDI